MTLLPANAWQRPWYGMLAPYGRPTDDARMFDDGSIDRRTLPMPLRLQIQSAPGHYGSVIVGSITGWTSTPEGVFAVGRWLDPSAVPEVNRALALADAGVARPSIDLQREDLVAEVTPGTEAGTFANLTTYRHSVATGATIVASDAAFDGTFIRPLEGDLESGMLRDQLASALTASGFYGEILEEEDGASSLLFVLSGTTSWRTMPIAPREMEFNRDHAMRRILVWANGNEAKARSMFLWIRPESAVGAQDRYVFPIGDIVDGKPHMVFHAIYSIAAILNGAHGGVKDIGDADRAKLRGTVTEMYARMGQEFKDPALEAPWVKRDRLPERSRTASAVPVAPPRAWFETPEPDRPTALTITDDGRVFGHLASWNQCHVGLGQMSGECVTAPRSSREYALFHTGTVRTSDGGSVKVGRITVDTTHPTGWVGARLNASATARHYDHTGTCAAVVRAVDGQHGIWLSGALVPEADEAMAAKLRRHPLSGDWRRDRGNLELVAALSVNSPGFPIVGVDERGERFSLMASAGPACLDRIDEATLEAMTADDSTTNENATENDETSGLDTGVSPLAAPVDIDYDAVAQRAVDMLTQRAQVQERLATIAAVDYSERADRLRTIGREYGIEE
jgi:hypothetical protein